MSQSGCVSSASTRTARAVGYQMSSSNMYAQYFPAARGSSSAILSTGRPELRSCLNVLHTLVPGDEDGKDASRRIRRAVVSDEQLEVTELLGEDAFQGGLQ